MTRSDHWRERTEALSTGIYGERKRDHAEFLDAFQALSQIGTMVTVQFSRRPLETDESADPTARGRDVTMRP
jgi:hypothetical protein